MLTVRLPEELETRLTLLAIATKRSKSFYVREALDRTIEDIEDAYLADAAYERFLSSGKKSIPLAKVMSHYELED
ncbi:MAG: ribbon-helix-helix protein, CopG family [Desulfarculales bacterium]|jgi:RHH-type rel operon transcriptional repressor/antitoxin RelB|nr:ribbon-helix-helix protein, CopG family [Desulfarculales bacterium]